MAMATVVSLIMDITLIVMEDFMVTTVMVIPGVMAMAILAIMEDTDSVMVAIMADSTAVVCTDLEDTMEVFTALVVTNCAITQRLMAEMNAQAICHPNGTQTSVVHQVLQEETHTYQGQLQELAADLVHRPWFPIREGLLQQVLILNRLSVTAELFRASQTSAQVLLKELLPIQNRHITVQAGLILRVITIPG